ncbi:hypothetical protein [Mucilaginibacter endophyticus]|uniref:hypothetical protein n=1 Tax=Mucilaginibacter endophyticus TaxID=2675003 RepID=UPI000E0DCB95|nr:hypothetical protein [Mucilaginibacter endophyticus]
MIHKLNIILISVAFLAASCSSQKQATGLGQQNPASGLKVEMEQAAATATKDSLMITFTVINDTDKPLRFVKWETPFEPRLGKYFEIKGTDGNEAVFKGAMARRVMPPPPEAYMEVKAHDRIKTTIDLSDYYTINEGSYEINYVGGGVSGLIAPNGIAVIIK